MTDQSDDFFSQAYDELRRLAAGKLRNERVDHTLPPTALVHELYFRIKSPEGGFKDTAHFMGSASQVMRQILVDHARKKNANKRGGKVERVPLGDPAIVLKDPDKIIALDELIDLLKGRCEERAQLAELQYFAGLNLKESAAAIGMDYEVAKKKWAYAKAWMRDAWDRLQNEELGS
ncbi:MAG: ECF-type sigma factor [Planctomycetaceae bacterium]